MYPGNYSDVLYFQFWKAVINLFKKFKNLRGFQGLIDLSSNTAPNRGWKDTKSWAVL